MKDNRMKHILTTKMKLECKMLPWVRSASLRAFTNDEVTGILA